MENNRSSWGSNLGFLLAAIGSAVGLGNIWGFPYKMGKSGGFTFLIVYLLLAVFVGMIIMVSELAVGRKTKLSPIDAYKKVSEKFAWIGWLATIAPFLIMSFYTVLGGYCLQYIALNMTKLSFGNDAVAMSGGDVFGAMLTTPLGCVVFTALFIVICMVIVQGGVSSGIEQFNKIGMPALFVMLLIIIVRSLTLPDAAEGLKFMFVPGYAVKAGFIDKAPDLITVLGTAGGQMFFSLSLAMGAMITYGSYLSKSESLPKNSVIITVADTLVAIMAGIAVIPAAVAHGMAQIDAGELESVAQIKLNGPGLLFSTLQNVFHSMGVLGAIIGLLFFVLVLIAAVSSAISLVEAVSVTFIDRASAKGHEVSRPRTVGIVCVVIMIFAIFVCVDGLAERPFTPADMFGWKVGTWNDCWLDFMDVWSEGIAMPLGALIMALMIGWELKPKFFADEIKQGDSGKCIGFWGVCMKFIVPVVMVFVLLVQISGFFDLGWF